MIMKRTMSLSNKWFVLVQPNRFTQKWLVIELRFIIIDEGSSLVLGRPDDFKSSLERCSPKTVS